MKIRSFIKYPFISRYIRFVLAISIIAIIVNIVVVEVNNMTNPNEIVEYSEKDLELEQNSTDFYNYILVGSIFISLIATIFLIFHSNRLSKLKDIQLAIVQTTQTESNVKIASLNKDTEQAKKDIANANLKAKELENENLKLKQSTLPRFIDITKFANTFSKYSGSKIEIRAIQDGEAQNLKEQLINSFRIAKWTVNYNILDGVKHNFSGVKILINPEQFTNEVNIKTLPVLDEIEKELKRYNINSTIERTDDTHQENYIILFIGFRENPFAKMMQ